MEEGRRGPRSGRGRVRGTHPTEVWRVANFAGTSAPSSGKNAPAARGRGSSRRARGRGRGASSLHGARVDPADDSARQTNNAFARFQSRGRPYRGGLSRGNRKLTSSTEGRIMGYQKLKTVRNLDPVELIQLIVIEREGFLGLLHCEKLSADTVALILQILDSACECETVPSTRIKLLSEVQNSEFLKSELSRFLVKLTTGEIVSNVKQSLQHTLSLMKVLLTCVPSSLPDVMVVFGSFEMVYRHFHSASSSFTATSDMEKLVTFVRDLIEDLTSSKQKQVEKKKLCLDDDAAPPDDFRNIPIFPQLKDIHLNEVPFLRANKDKGGYRDLNHYLDVQYRLMREDFVAPLRDGITEFIAAERTGNNSHRYKDIRLYFDVKINYPVCTSDGMLHQISFGTERLKKVRWEASKRLIYGSLLCLSKDNFTTLFFATVAERHPKDLHKGILYVKFEHDHHAIAEISPDDTFLMAETSAYFEAYRHVLRGLQRVGEELPFQRHIVHCQTDVEPPRYLRTDPGAKYDLTPLIDEKFKLDTDLDDDGIARMLRRTHIRDTNSESAIRILDTTRWPSAEKLHLDKSQLKAVKSALTKEFVVIQGPPGTGKTYVGLKIVRVLLHNKKVWCRGQQRPMLVVCYTNHALDQFLEGIQEFHDSGIIRVGGRSKSEQLEKYLMKNVRKSQQESIPNVIRRGLFDIRSNMERLEERMKRNVSLLKATEVGILGEHVLEQFMTPQHYLQLTEMMPDDLLLWEIQGANRSMMVEWLNLGLVAVDIPQTPEEGNVNDEEAFEEVDTMDDVAMEEEQRRLDDDDDDDQYVSNSALRGVTRPKGAKNVDNEIKIEVAGLAITLDSLSTEPEGLDASGWQISGDEKQRRKKLMKKELRKTTHMTNEEAVHVSNIWQLPLNQRWQLYRYWVNAYKTQIKEQMMGSERQYLLEQERLVEIKQRENLALMQKAVILGMTTTGAARYWHILQQVAPRIIIVEEAAEVMESHIVTTLSQGCEHLILIGDHKQLRPNPTVYQLALKFNLDISLFERMVNNGMECITLELQHRMKPEIATLMEPIYPELRNHESVHQYENILGLTDNMYFVDHSKEETYHEETKSRSNKHEARYLSALCLYLLKQGYEPAQITVLTTYSGQLFALKSEMPKHIFDGVRICVVDNYQGEENDIILLSLVRSNKEQSVGFLKTENRICVALSRAKKGFFVIGNITMLANESDLWSRLMHILRKQSKVGSELELVCRNHPETKIKAKDARDFQKAPEGGCLVPCEFRLKCGHVCQMPCHVTDTTHTEYKCWKRCTKVLCEMGHRCPKKCADKCGSCNVQVPKVLPSCGHTNKVPCHIPPEEFSCRMDCEKILSCGHQCAAACGEPCIEKCLEKVEKTWPICEHANVVNCFVDPEDNPCTKACEAVLACGHPCSGSCGRCFAGRLHDACRMPCERILVCGHACEEACTKDCPPCQQKCENRCIHSKCEEKCGIPCAPCMEPCQWRCKHKQCSKLCSEPCDRSPCNMRCGEKLKCGHQCIGLCGEQCPELCGICNKDEVNEIFFGTEDEEDAMFVQLEDCGHVLEVSGLDQWMGMQEPSEEGTINIQLKGCPKCKTPIRRNLRYGKLVNKMMADINQVKRKIFGKQIDIDATKDILLGELSVINLYDRKIAERLEPRIMNNNIHQDALCMYQTTVEVLKRLFNLRKKVDKELKEISVEIKSSPKDLDDIAVDKVLLDLREDIEMILEWCQRLRQRLSEQELQEAPLEVTRMSFLFNFAKLYRDGKKHYPEKKTTLSEVSRCVQRMRFKLTDERKQRYEAKLAKLRKELPRSGLHISERERAMIVQAVGLSKGHWFKCPKGHIYAIGDCGGANQKSSCPECKSVIGGERYMLAAGNVLAPEMDNARFAAWSEQANLENYQEL